MNTESILPESIKSQIEKESEKEAIYEPKYGGKDHSGYDTLMKYEVNGERMDAFVNGGEFGYGLALKELQAREKEAEFLNERINKYVAELSVLKSRVAQIAEDTWIAAIQRHIYDKYTGNWGADTEVPRDWPTYLDNLKKELNIES